MNIFSRILVNTDGSDGAERAVDFAAALAQEHGSDLTICHFVNWVVPVSETPAAESSIDSAVVAELRALGDGVIERAKLRAQAAGVAAQARLLDGETAPGILEFARAEASTLIVMATLDEDVLRGSLIPVLTVNAGAKRAGAGRCFERIVVGIDDSEPSDAALATVIDFPPEDRRHVQLIGVAGSAFVIGDSEYHHAVLDELHEATEHVLDAAEARAQKRGCVFESRIVDGRPAAALVAAAKADQADLIVLGSHGRRGMRRLFLGSVAEGVVRSSAIPVLVVRGLQKASVPITAPARAWSTVEA